MNRAVVSAACVGAFAFALAAPARADAPPAIDGDLRDYYGGERTSAYVVIGIGVPAAVAGGVLATRDGDFARGLGWPLITMGAVEAVGAVFYAVKVGGEIDHYESLLARSPADYRAQELDHIDGTTSRFVGYRLGELGLTLAGVGMAAYGFAAGSDAWKGVGIGVGGMALPFLVIDTINNARATRYRERVRDFQPSIGVAPTAGGGFTLSIGGVL
jgi:hypothetical protein